MPSRTSPARRLKAAFVEPMKALGVTAVPSGQWRCEIKYDGYRALAVVNGAEVELWSRNHKSMAQDYPEIVEALRGLRCRSAIVDGEIVALDESGRSHFQLLQNRASRGSRPPIACYLFDLLHLDGVDLTAEPIEERQRRLAALVPKRKGPLQLSPWYDVEPAELLAVARKLGLEGIIAKRRGSRYEPGVRSGAWVKCKLVAEQEFVIGGFTEPRGGRRHFGAIAVGYYEKGELRFAGKVGSGFDGKLLQSLHARFESLRIEDCPFADLPREKTSRFGTGMTAAEMRRVTWIRPRLVAQVRFSEWTGDGLLRQPVFLGLREDKAAREVRREPGTI